MMCGASSQFFVCFGMLAGLLGGICPVADVFAAQKTAPSRQKSAAVAVSNQGERIVRVYDLKYAIETLLPIIEAAVPDAYVVSNAPRRQLSVIASQSAHERLAELIKELDVPPRPPEQESIKMFHLVNAQAPAMLPIITSIFPAGQVKVAVGNRTNFLLAKGPEDKLKEIEAVLLKLDQAPDRDPQQLLNNKMYRVHIAWFAEGPSSDKATNLDSGLPVVRKELSRIGLESMRPVGQTMVSTTLQGQFEVGCSSSLGDGPAELEISGMLTVLREAAHLQIRISAGQDQALADADAGKTKRVQLVNLATQIVAPLGHYVVLGVTPVKEKTLAFAVQIQSDD